MGSFEGKNRSRDVYRFGKRILHPEDQPAFFKAQAALNNCLNGHFEQFPDIRNFLAGTDKYDDRGLGLPETEYKRLEAEYEKFKLSLPKDEE